MADDPNTGNILAIADEHRAALLKKEKSAALRMVDAYGKIYGRLFNELQALNQDIQKAKLAGEEVSAGWLARQKRYQKLIAQVNAQLGQFRQDAGLEITALQKAAIQEAAKAGKDAANTAGVSGQFHELPTQSVEYVVGFLGDGSPLKRLLGSLGAAASENIQKRLVESVALGYGARKAANLIRADLGGNLARSLLIARTETLRAYRTSTSATIKQNQDILDGWYWRSARNSRCCLACIALDGTFHPADEPMKSHPGCRCVQVFAVDGMEPPEKGSEWFEEQNDDVKRKIIGTNAGWEQYQKGKLKPEDFVGLAKNPVWGDAYYQLGVGRALNGEGAFPGDAPKPVKIAPPPKPIKYTKEGQGRFSFGPGGPKRLPKQLGFDLPEPDVKLGPPVAEVPPQAPLFPVKPPPRPVKLPDLEATPPPKIVPAPVPDLPMPEFVKKALEPPPPPPPVKPKKAAKPKAPKKPKEYTIATLPTLPIEDLRKVDWHKKEETWKTDAAWNRRSYGGIVFDDEGRILLREPRGHFDGYHWTFPKGKLDSENEPPVDTALREVAEETGHEGEVIGVLKNGHKGGTGESYFFMMRSKGVDQSKMDKETTQTRWVTWEEAEELIKQTTNATGQARDLGILAQAKSQYAELLKGKDLDKFKAKKTRKKKEVAAPPPEPEEVIPDLPRKERDVAGFPTSPADLQLVKTLGGSTGAELVRDPATGKQYVRKRGASPDHLREEFYADEAYAALGVDVPAAKLYEMDGGPVKLAEFIEGRTLGELSASERRTAEKQLRQHFAADALLGNWDAIGMNADNVIVGNDGRAYRIDNGGSLRYRAMGTKKTAEQWNKYPVELWTLRDKNVNAQMARMAAASSTAEEGRLSIYDLRRQIDDIAKRREDLLAALPADLRPEVDARLRNLKDVARAAKDFEEDKWRAEYMDEFGKHMIGLRKEGIVDRLPSKLTHRGASSHSLVRPVDEEGREFDKLRGRGGIVEYLDAYMRKHGTSQVAMASFTDEQGGSSWSGKPLAIKAYLASQRGVDASSYHWRDSESGAARELERWVRQSDGDPRVAFQIYHAFNYEFFGKTAMPNNDRKNKMARLIRTETDTVIRTYGVKRGEGQRIKRGVHESASVFNAAFPYGSETTVQNVPHHRMTISYLIGQRPGSDKTCFLSDGENEVLFIPEGIECEYLGHKVEPKPEPGT